MFNIQATMECECGKTKVFSKVLRYETFNIFSSFFLILHCLFLLQNDSDQIQMKKRQQLVISSRRKGD